MGPIVHQQAAAALAAGVEGAAAAGANLVGGFSRHRASPSKALSCYWTALPAKTLLYDNVPAGAPRGLRFACLGHRVYSEKIVE